MADTIMRFDPARRTNAAAILDCVALGYLSEGQKIFDATYGESGGFWTKWEPNHAAGGMLESNDLDPSVNCDHHLDYRDTNLPDNAFDVTVFDPPYKLNGTGGNGPGDQRFGVATPYTSPTVILDDHQAGLREMVRITKPGGLILYKTKDQVTSGRYTPLSRYAYVFMRMDQGCALVDELYVHSWITQPPRTRRCDNCDGSGTFGGTYSDSPTGGVVFKADLCDDCLGSGRVESRQHHFASNCSVLQIWRKPK